MAAKRTHASSQVRLSERHFITHIPQTGKNTIHRKGVVCVMCGECVEK